MTPLAWTDAPVLDATQLHQLAQLPAGDVAELAELYERHSGRLLAGLVDALRDGDAGSAGAAAHTLKGGSANMGAGRLAVLCAQLEVAAAGGHLARARALAAAVPGEREAFIGMLRDYLGAPQGPPRATTPAGLLGDAQEVADQ